MSNRFPLSFPSVIILIAHLFVYSFSRFYSEVSTIYLFIHLSATNLYLSIDFYLYLYSFLLNLNYTNTQYTYISIYTILLFLIV